jgi:hypothetical protein
MKITGKVPVLITCSNGHEWWVKVAKSMPPQPQTIACPICRDQHEVMLPKIAQVESLLTT